MSTCLRRSGRTLAFLLLGHVAAAATFAPTAARAETVLKTAIQDDISTLDPDNGFDASARGLLRAVYEGLVQYAPESTRVVGQLAESWTISPDFLTYTFKLHKGVTFQDGKPLDAAAVKASFERRRVPAMATSYFLAGVGEMSAPDAQTFVIHLSAPQPSFLDTLASAWGPKVISPGILVDHAGSDLAATWLNDHAVGSGPYSLTEATRGQRYVLTKNAAYWGPKPFYDKVQIAVTPDIGQQILQLAAGDLDLVMHGYPYSQLGAVPASLTVHASDTLSLEMAYVNSTKALKNPAIRQAVLTAVAPGNWTKDAFGSFAAPAMSVYPKALLQPASPIAYPTDMKAATAAISAAGPTTVEIGYSTEEAGVQQRVADLLVAQLQAIGITATSRSLPIAQLSSLATDLAAAPDLYLAQNYPDAADPATLADLFYGKGGALNVLASSDPEVDALLDKARVLPTRAERDTLYNQAGQLLYERVLTVPLADVQEVIVAKAGLTDLGTRPAYPWTVDFSTIHPAQ